MCREIIWVRVKDRVMGRVVPEFTSSVLYRASLSTFSIRLHWQDVPLYICYKHNEKS
jgi:hypothetical protein